MDFLIESKTEIKMTNLPNVSLIKGHWPMTYRIISREHLLPRHSYLLIRQYVKRVYSSNESTQELSLVFDKTLHISLFWNPVGKMWRIAYHNHNGWSSPFFLSTRDLLVRLQTEKELLTSVFAIQYRSLAGIRIHQRTL
jgi:hypothetical protein